MARLRHEYHFALSAREHSAIRALASQRDDTVSSVIRLLIQIGLRSGFDDSCPMPIRLAGKPTTVHLRLSSGLAKSLEAAAVSWDMSMAALVKGLIHQGLQEPQKLGQVPADLRSARRLEATA